MVWKNKYRKLYDSVRKKLGDLSEPALDKRLQRKSRNLGLASSEAALIVIAAENRLGYQKEFLLLSDSLQTRVTNIIQNFSNNTILGEQVATNFVRKKIDHNTNLPHEFSDPHLKDSDYKKIPSEAYSIMYILENSIRIFIVRILEGEYGQRWWSEAETKKSLEEVVKKVADRMKNEANNWCHSRRGVHEIYYADFDHLIKLIRVFDKDFSKYFNKGAAKNLLGKLDELIPSRNVIAHNNPITDRDLARMKVNAGDWFSYMQSLFQSNEN